MLTLENTTLHFTGIQGSSDIDEERPLIHFEVISENAVYAWMKYAPNTTSDFNAFLESNKQLIIDDINAKEAIWLNTPKTRDNEDRFSGQTITVEVNKESVVKPDIPDYYALRRKEYPTYGAQLGAIFKGVESEEYLTILDAIQAVKNKYPKN